MSITGKRNENRGDTIVEVMFALAIFSLVAVGSLSIMNQGAATAQRALEITLVRNEIDAQAEALRFLNSSYIANFQRGSASYTNSGAEQWRQILDNTVTTPSAWNTASSCPDNPSKSFVVNTRKATLVTNTSVIVPAETSFSQVYYDGANTMSKAEGIWIEAIDPNVTTDNNQGDADYVDFHIRACWDSPGQSVPVTLGTIVRLYEPR
ncbi:type II secretion system protein [Candidatus Saccharibacteria bacterium]|nr:type II secretion system protein [Candidatus Saccharibacteria bacterium]